MYLSFAHWLVVLSACIKIAGSYVYIRDTIAGKTKPNRMTWAMWSIAPLIGTIAALSAQADPWATVRIFLAGFLPLLVLCSSFINPQSYWKLTRFDALCGICSAVAFAIWMGSDSAKLAILLAATGDAFASLPTIRKCWQYPETETKMAYVASFISVLLVIPSITIWNIENSAFLIFLFAQHILLLGALYGSQWKRKNLSLA